MMQHSLAVNQNFKKQGIDCSGVWLTDALVSQLNIFADVDLFRTHTLVLCMCTRKEGIVSFNDALNTFYLRLYGVRHMVKDHSDRLLFPISSKGSFICTIPQTG